MWITVFLLCSKILNALLRIFFYKRKVKTSCFVMTYFVSITMILWKKPCMIEDIVNKLLKLFEIKYCVLHEYTFIQLTALDFTHAFSWKKKGLSGLNRSTIVNFWYMQEGWTFHFSICNTILTLGHHDISHNYLQSVGQLYVVLGRTMQFEVVQFLSLRLFLLLEAKRCWDMYFPQSCTSLFCSCMRRTHLVIIIAFTGWVL